MISPTTAKKTFPRGLPHGSGKPMTLVPDYLLLALKKAVKKPSDLQKKLDSSRTGLVLVTSGKKGKHNTVGQEDKINNTKTRFWVRTRNKKPVSAKHLTALSSRNWQTRLDWIGPVYRTAKSKGIKGYMCPLPTAFMIKLAWKDSDPDAGQRRAKLSEYLTRFQFKEVPDESKYPFHYWYAKREPIEQTSLYDLYQVYKKKKEKEPDWEGHRLAERLNFDVMPMIIRQAAYTPSDPFYAPYQWNMRRINAEYGWGLARGNGVRIAILDYGFALNHPDLQRCFRSNLGIYLGDMNGNGAGNTTNPHGTACAGVVGAEMDNEGVAGLAPACKIIPLAFEHGDSSEVVDAIEHAVDNQADVICISHHSEAWDDDNLVNDAIAHAHHRGVLICAAAGNDDGGPVTYPANHPLVMACGAMDTNNVPAGFSNSGAEISVLAPGVAIATTAPLRRNGSGGDYFTQCKGTSYAVPHVAGLAALLISAFPELKDKPDAIRAIIEESAEELSGIRAPYKTAMDPSGTRPRYPDPGRSGGGKGRNDESGFGLINVENAFRLAAQRHGNPTPL